MYDLDTYMIYLILFMYVSHVNVYIIYNNTYT